MIVRGVFQATVARVKALALASGASCHAIDGPVEDRAPPRAWTTPSASASSTRIASAALDAGAAIDATTPDSSVPRISDGGVFRAQRPVVLPRFVRGVSSSRTWTRWARTPVPDGAPDAVFDVVIEGDYVQLVVRCSSVSYAAVSSRPELDRRPQPSPSGPVMPPRARSAAWAITKHQPVLFPYEKGELVAWSDTGELALTSTGAKRALRLRAYAPADTRGCQVQAERPDGTGLGDLRSDLPFAHLSQLSPSRASACRGFRLEEARGTRSPMARPYLELLELVLEKGKDRQDRTGTGTRGIFGHQMRFDLREGFPLLTTKKLHTKSIVHELLWFLRGETHVKPLQDAGVRIWNEWATAEQTARFGRGEGDLGPVYGHQWRNFGATRLPDGTYAPDGFDQLNRLVNDIQENPNSRRLVVTGWNPKEATEVALPPCHTLFQFYVEDGELSCQLYQRSADIFLGVPFNVASYALLTHLVAHVTGLRVGDFVHTLGDAHLYRNHFEQARTQLARTPRPLPRLTLTSEARDLFSFRYEDIAFEGYDPHPHIAAEVSV